MTSRWVALAILFLTVREGVAQTTNVPRVELGGSLSGILPVLPADGPGVVIAGGPRLGLNVTRTIGLQASIDVLAPFDDRGGTNGLYEAAAKFAVRHGQDGQRTLSITAGLAGGFQYLRRGERRVTRPDGSIVVTPPHRRLRTTNLTTVVVGVTGDHVVSRHSALSTGIHVFIGELGGMAIRGSIGMAFAIGGYR